MINMITFSHFDLQFRDILNYHEFFIFHLIFILNLTCSDQLSWECPCPLLTAFFFFFFFATLFENCKLTYADPNAIETCLIPNHFFYGRQLSSVCNFQSIKSPVELNNLFLKFFCRITWFD